ncbi:MAG: efflux RND transporter periplasmic adaptor subunit [Azoarcus sp.]|jgi:cobalt-zinc-cadmium efflux system membrane fusion protein|nr:efflux RND transporter periplasmic adaptor subunit [Azoarcus sp.]
MNKNTFNLTRKQKIAIAVILAAGIVAGAWIPGGSTLKPAGEQHEHASHAEARGHTDAEHHGGKAGDGHDHAGEHEDSEHHEDAPKSGPHGGRLFSEDGFGLELLLSEDGGEPGFRVWLFQQDKPLAPTAAEVSIVLTRPGGEKQEILLTAGKDYLKSTHPVAEPHVFEAAITARLGETPFLFIDTREEGKIELTDEQVKAAAIGIQKATPAKIKTAAQLPGEIRFNEDRTAHVVPRLAGVVESVPANLGQTVKRGQVLAVIASTSLSEQRSELLAAQKRFSMAKSTYARETQLWEEKISAEQDYLQARQTLREAEIAVANSQQKLVALGAGATVSGSLNRYEIRAPFDGMVVEKHITLGEAVKEDASIFTISDLSLVWAEIVVPARDLNVIRVGEKVVVKATAFESEAEGSISYVGALLGQDTRTAKARVTLPNPEMAWRPGLFVNIEVVSGEAEVPVSVLAEAIQTIGDKSVVFIKVPDGFVAQPVTLGRSDGKYIEVVSGMKAGTPYAASGSFVLKSELGKGSAEHSH